MREVQSWPSALRAMNSCTSHGLIIFIDLPPMTWGTRWLILQFYRHEMDSFAKRKYLLEWHRYVLYLSFHFGSELVSCCDVQCDHAAILHQPLSRVGPQGIAGNWAFVSEHEVMPFHGPTARLGAETSATYKGFSVVHQASMRFVSLLKPVSIATAKSSCRRMQRTMSYLAVGYQQPAGHDLHRWRYNSTIQHCQN